MRTKIPKPDRKTLASFGYLSGGLVVALFGLILPWLRGGGYPRWPWVAAAVLVAWAIAAPRTLAPVYRVWMFVGHILGWINTRVLLGAIFLLVIVPMAIVMRLIGRDLLARSFDPLLESYRVPSVSAPRKKMEVPY
jgi:hypothetical protein